MAWRQHFIDWLEAPVANPQFRLEIATVDGYMPGAALSHGSHVGVSLATAAVTRTGSRITAGTLSPIDYSYTTGSATLGIKSDTELRRLVPRGALVRVMLGEAGWSDELFEPIFFGQMVNLQGGARQGWTMELKSIVGSLQSRFTQFVAEGKLFFDLGSYSLTSDYTAGDGTLNITTTTGLEKLTGGNYLVQVYPDSGDPFFLEATGKGATTVTGCSAAGQIGTTAADAGAGNTVVLCAFLEKNPVDAAIIVLTSTGGGLNGDYDLAPDSWGLGLSAGYVDIDDCMATRAIVTPTTGSELWDIYATEPQQDAGEWLRGVLQPAGMWLCERQGLITVRAIRPIEGYNQYLTMSVQDADIVDLKYDAYDPAQPAEYGQVKLLSATTSDLDASFALFTRPVVDLLVYELPFCEENETAWLDQTAGRLSQRPMRVGEVVTITTKGWKYAQLTPGDEVVLYTRFFQTWDTPISIGTVISVQPDWFGATTEIKVVFNDERPEFS